MSFTLSLKSPLQSIELIMLFIWLRAFSRSHCPQGKVTLLVRIHNLALTFPGFSPRSSCKTLVWPLDIHALSLALIRHCFRLWLEAISPIILQSAPFLSPPRKRQQLFPCMCFHSSLYPSQLYLSPYYTALVHHLFDSFTSLQTSGPKASPWTPQG